MIRCASLGALLLGLCAGEAHGQKAAGPGPGRVGDSLLTTIASAYSRMLAPSVVESVACALPVVDSAMLIRWGQGAIGRRPLDSILRALDSASALYRQAIPGGWDGGTRDSILGLRLVAARLAVQRTSLVLAGIDADPPQLDTLDDSLTVLARTEWRLRQRAEKTFLISRTSQSRATAVSCLAGILELNSSPRTLTNVARAGGRLGLVLDLLEPAPGSLIRGRAVIARATALVMQDSLSAALAFLQASVASRPVVDSLLGRGVYSMALAEVYDALFLSDSARSWYETVQNDVGLPAFRRGIASSGIAYLLWASGEMDSSTAVLDTAVSRIAFQDANDLGAISIAFGRVRERNPTIEEGRAAILLGLRGLLECSDPISWYAQRNDTSALRARMGFALGAFTASNVPVDTALQRRCGRLLNDMQPRAAARYMIDQRRDQPRVALFRADSALRRNEYPRAAKLFRALDTLARAAHNAPMAVTSRYGEALSSLNASDADSRCVRIDTLLAEASAVLVAMARANSEATRVQFIERHGSVYELWARSLLECADSLAPDPGVALGALEMGRAQALRDQLNRQSRSAAMVLDSMLAHTSAEREAAVRRVDRALNRYRQQQATVVSYLTAEDALYVWIALPNGAVSVERRLVKRCQLQRLVALWREQLAVDAPSRGTSGVRAVADIVGEVVEDPRALRRGCPVSGIDDPAEALSSVLIPPRLYDALSHSRELLLVSQGPLASLPMTALPVGKRRVLGDVIPIRQVPFLDFEGTLPGTRSRTATALVVADPQLSHEFAVLPAARIEGSTIARMLGAVPLLGSRATESEVRRRISEATIVHFATHGVAYTGSAASRSFIALSPGIGDDGRLTTREIAGGPRLSADLVVLSACQTGLGDVKLTEGTIGLARAFLQGGARSVLVSLWSVSDQATSLLMQNFYRHWLQDPDHPGKSEALRRAQNDVRRMPGFSSPRYWAAFQLVGAN